MKQSCPRMRRSGASGAVLLAAFVAGCSSQASRSVSTAGTTATSASASCQAEATLTGASYDVSRSRFAFGSTPVAEDAGAFVRWVGADGVVGIWSDGSELGVMNATAPETSLPDWSGTSSLAAHVSQYFASMGVATCQIANQGIDSSGGGGGSIDGGSFVGAASSSTVVLSRGVDGIPVVESVAAARFDSNDQTTSETFYWPEIPASVVAAARSFRDRLADPATLASYKALLPSTAQGDGQVVIHHSHAGSSGAFQTGTTYDVAENTPFGSQLSFDANGNPVTTAW